MDGHEDERGAIEDRDSHFTRMVAQAMKYFNGIYLITTIFKVWNYRTCLFNICKEKSKKWKKFNWWMCIEENWKISILNIRWCNGEQWFQQEGLSWLEDSEEKKYEGCNWIFSGTRPDVILRFKAYIEAGGGYYWKQIPLGATKYCTKWLWAVSFRMKWTKWKGRHFLAKQAVKESGNE